jgi:hypothetical protein
MKYALALTLVAAVSGCIVDEGEDTTFSSDESEVLSSNRIALNGLTLDRTLLGEVARGGLTTAPSRAPQLFATDLGRETFSYLVSCALKAGNNVTVTVNGVQYTYMGAIGLEDAWLKNPLPLKSYQYVSSCILARTNYFGVSVPISLRGPDYTTSAAEKTAFTVVEGAFWGDVFTPGADMAACSSPLKLSGSTISTLPLRECTVSLDGITTKCGFRYAGDCSRVCNADGSGVYTTCGTAKTATVFLAAP